MKVLAVFPPLHDANPGGIQVAGRIAWDALRHATDARLLEVSAGSRVQAMRAARSLRFDADVVLFWHLDLLRLAPLLRGRARRAVFLHGIEAWRPPGPITRRLLRDCAIFSNSYYTVARAREHMMVPVSVEIVPLGLGGPAADLAPPAPTPIALMIGRLDQGERYKGHHEVISAWSSVQQRLPGAQLWIVGDGDLRDELEALANERQLAEVRFFGRISDADKDGLLRAARCLVLPSRGEGFGLVYLEAMRHARPCLVGNDAGREVVNPPEAGIGVDPADPDQLVSALVHLLTPGPEWERMSAAARRRYADNFTARHFQDRLLAALERVH
jgi:phosphatidylinositol alpha-1,6-mannosyltransferase